MLGILLWKWFRKRSLHRILELSFKINYSLCYKSLHDRMKARHPNGIARTQMFEIDRNRAMRRSLSSLRTKTRPPRISHFPETTSSFYQKKISGKIRVKKKRKSQWDRFIDRGSVGSILEIE